MGLVDALIGLKKSREQWAMEGPVREASVAKLQAEAAKAQSDQKLKDKWAKIFDNFIKKQFPDGLPQPQQPPTAEGQKPPGLSDMMPKFSNSFPSAPTGDRAGSSNEVQGVMPQNADQMPGMQPAQAVSQQGQPQAQGPLSGMTTQQAMAINALSKKAGMPIDALGMIGKQTAIDSLEQRKIAEKRLASQGAQRIQQQKRSIGLTDEDRDLARAQSLKIANKPVLFRFKEGGRERGVFQDPFTRETIGKSFPMGGKVALSTEAATKLSGMQIGIKGIQSVRKMITGTDGKIDRSKLAQYRPVPFLPNFQAPDWAAKMFGDDDPVGLQIHTYLAQAFEALIRGESGAAVPPEEIKRLSKRYGVSWSMSDKTINMRLDTLELVLGQAVKTIDPNDRYKYDPDDITYRVHPDGRVEYILLPTAGHKKKLQTRLRFDMQGNQIND